VRKQITLCSRELKRLKSKAVNIFRSVGGIRTNTFASQGVFHKLLIVWKFLWVKRKNVWSNKFEFSPPVTIKILSCEGALPQLEDRTLQLLYILSSSSGNRILLYVDAFLSDYRGSHCRRCNLTYFKCEYVLVCVIRINVLEVKDILR
jgi:hypothetical protein